MILGLGIIILMVMDFNSRIAELNRLGLQHESVGDQVSRLIVTNEYLQTQVAYATSVGAVDEWARDEGNLIQPGDRLIVPLPGGTVTPQVEVQPTPDYELIHNWEVWFALFFDRAP